MYRQAYSNIELRPTHAFHLKYKKKQKQMAANTHMDPEGVRWGGPDPPPLKNEIYKIVKVKLSLV